MQDGHTIAVLGAGNMGTALAQVLAYNGHTVKLWNWEKDHAPLKQIEKCRENKKYLPGIKLHPQIKPAYHIDEAVKDAAVVFLVVPSEVMEHTIGFAARSIKQRAVIVDMSKGVEPHSLQLIPNIIAKHVHPSLRQNIVTMSGPAIARQMADKQYTAMNIASRNKQAIKLVQQVLENSFIKLFPTTDVIGVEVSGSFKNVYAIALGICDGLKLGLNTKAALLTRALQEMADLIEAMGGQRETAYALAGFGDLIGTALCDDSRNRQFGECLAKGLKCAAALKKVKQTVEGISATQCLLRLAKKHEVRVPFAEMVGGCIRGRKKVKNLMIDFLAQKW